MKTLILMACLTGSLLLGCQEDFDPQDAQRREVNSWLVSAPGDVAIRNAIVRQQTVYPYYFVVNGSQLNELGARDLAVLAEHYQQNPGRLSIRRGEASEDLYDARVATVKEAMAEAGVDMARVQIEDAPAGGDGISSEIALLILAQEFEPTGYAAPTAVTVKPAGNAKRGAAK